MSLDISEVKNVQLRPVKLDHGEHMKAESWREAVCAGGFIHEDGIGFLATETEESNISIWSIANWLEWPKWATYVVWYNR